MCEDEITMPEKKWTRRTLALMFGATSCGVCGYLAVQGNPQALIAVIALGSAAAGFYLGAKTGAEIPEP